MPDLDRTTLPKRTAEELARSLRERAKWITGQVWEGPATAAMMIEAAELIESSAPSEAPAEAFTLGQAFVSRVTGADNPPDLSVMGAGDGLPLMFTPEQILDEAEMHAMDGEAGAMCAAMLRELARLVRERHTFILGEPE